MQRKEQCVRRSYGLTRCPAYTRGATRTLGTGASKPCIGTLVWVSHIASGSGAAGVDRVTFATSSGIVWLALAVHFAAGLVSIVAGTIALSVAKGGRLHKQSGLVFTWAMIVLGLTAAAIGTYENRPSQVFAGLVAAYLVFSAMTTVKPLPAIGQRFNVALAVVVFAYAVASLYGGVTEWLDPTV